MRAVRGYIDEVGFRAPYNILVELVQQLVRAGKAAVLRNRRIESVRANFYIFFINALNGRVTEAHISKRGRISLIAVLTDIRCRGFGGAKKSSIQRAVFIENFGVANGYNLPRTAFQFNFHNARKVLTEIVNNFVAEL